MDGLIGLLVVWGVISFVGGMLKKNKQASRGRDSAASDEQTAASVKKPDPAPSKPSVWEQIDMMNSMFGADDKADEGETDAVAPAPAQMSMNLPDSGAVSQGFAPAGSLGKASGEGLSKPGSLAGYSGFNFSAYKTRKTADSTQNAAETVSAGRFSTRDMKSAVVMAEVLSRPVAMRPKGVAFQKRRCLL